MSFVRLWRSTVELELAQLRRQRAFVVLTVVAALSFLATVSLFGLTGSELPLAFVDEDHSPASQRFEEALRGVKHAFSLRALPPERAEEQLRTGKLVGILTIPRGFAAAVARGETVALPVEVDNLDTDLLSDVQRALPSAVLAFGQARGLPGLRVQLLEKDLVPRETGFLEYISVSALGLAAFLVGAILGALSLAREWEDRTAKMIRVAPARLAPVLLGKGTGRRELFRRILEGIRIDFYCSVLVDQIESQDEAHAVALSDKNALDALHEASCDADFLAHNEVRIRLNLPAEEAGSQEFHFSICHRNIVPAIANDMQDSWRLEDLHALPMVDAHKKIGGEQRQNRFDALAVLPYSNGLISGEKGLDISEAQMFCSRLLILWNCVDCVPLAF